MAEIRYIHGELKLERNNLSCLVYHDGKNFFVESKNSKCEQFFRNLGYKVTECDKSCMDYNPRARETNYQYRINKLS